MAYSSKKEQKLVLAKNNQGDLSKKTVSDPEVFNDLKQGEDLMSDQKNANGESSLFDRFFNLFMILVLVFGIAFIFFMHHTLFGEPNPWKEYWDRIEGEIEQREPQTKEAWLKEELPGKVFAVPDLDYDTYRFVVEEIGIGTSRFDSRHLIAYLTGRFLVKSEVGNLNQEEIMEERSQILSWGSYLTLYPPLYSEIAPGEYGVVGSLTFKLGNNSNTVIEVVKELPEADAIVLPSRLWPPSLDRGGTYRDSVYSSNGQLSYQIGGL